MKRNLILGCLALISACGGDEGGGGDDGATGKKGKPLTPAEQVELCEAKLASGFGQAEQCDMGALGEATKESCEESRASCLKFIDPEADDAAADPAACKQLVEVSPDLFSGCTGNLGDIKACMKAVNEQISKLIGDDTCSNLEAAQQVKTPAPCEKLSDSCYELIRVM